MVAFLVTMTAFTLVGWAFARAVHAQHPGTFPGALATYYLLGVAANGLVLYLLVILHIPITRWTELSVLAASLVAGALPRKTSEPRPSLRHPLTATLLLAIPCAVLISAAAVLPIRDFDGRVTWLPKAVAIANTGAADGAFFQGREGVDMHNRYPLLVPLDAAAILLLCGDTSIDTTRWLYVLMAVAALFATRDLLEPFAGSLSAWTIAAAAWLPVLPTIEGGALAAYNDWAIAALTGLAVLYAMSDAAHAQRLLALVLAALVLTKNEGIVIAIVIVAAVLVARRRMNAVAIAAPFAALGLLTLWRMRVPVAYDERYDVLVQELHRQWHRIADAAEALAIHAVDSAAWGAFWTVTAVSVAVGLVFCRKQVLLPAIVLALMLAADIAALTITSWDPYALAEVAANRLLIHAAFPACIVIAIAIRHLLRMD